ncbi:MAG: hypothetical protein IKK41_02745 [Oscillospiraceae bacterium]|nr:hypothetical protein [Oscillospiraceae bacterium]
MKKCFILLLVMLLFAGCGAQETFETVSDAYNQPVSAPQWQMLLDVPQEASVSVLQGEDAGKIYLCDGYTVTVQTMASGDLEKTLRTLTGYEKEELTLMQTLQDGAKRYECVWVSAGEGEDQVGRLCLLDDGNYTYAVTAMAGETKAGELSQVWQEMFDSFRLVSPDVELNTGS